MLDKVDISRKIDDIYDIGKDMSAEDKARVDALNWVVGDSDSIVADMEATGRLATEAEVRKTIELLKQDRTKLPEYSYFGDPNWRMFDAQIEILQWVLS